MEEVAGTGSLNNLRVLRLISGEVVPVSSWPAVVAREGKISELFDFDLY
jgi:hypothetical protein